MIGNDINAHESAVIKCKDSAAALLQSTASSNEKRALEDKIENLTSGWEEIKTLYSAYQVELENAFDESRLFQEQTKDLLQWLSKESVDLKKKKPTGGKPDTAKEQLENHQVI